MKKLLSILFVSSLFLSCEKEEEPRICCTIVDISMGIKYVDENGENLLNAENGIDVSEIRVYDKIDDEWKISENPPRLNEDGEYLMVNTGYTRNDDDITMSKIIFADDSEDLIIAQLNGESLFNTIIQKVWYNDELVWDNADKEPRVFEIVKSNTIQ